MDSLEYLKTTQTVLLDADACIGAFVFFQGSGRHYVLGLQTVSPVNRRRHCLSAATMSSGCEELT